MIRYGLALALLLPLGSYHPQYLPAGPHFPTAAACPVLAAWPMNEGSGTTFNDTSGNGNNATIAVPATVTWTANAIKSGVTSPFFNGGTGGLTQDTNGSNLNFTGATPFTVAMWVNRGTSTTADTYLGDLNTPSTFNGWEVGTGGGGSKASFFLIGSITTNSLIVTGTNVIPASAVTYLVFAYDGTAATTGINSIKIYMNAVLETNVAVQNTFTTPPATSPNPRTFARRQNNGQPFTGPIGYVEVVGCQWDQAKISANFAGGPAIN